MRHEKIYTRHDGLKLKVTCTVVFTYKNTTEYTIDVWKCLPKKRTWYHAIDTDSFEYRNRSFPDGRIEYINEQIKSLLTPAEILEIKIELWNLIKPQ